MTSLSCYVVVQSFFNSLLGCEGTLGEYLEMAKEDAVRIGKRYLKPVSKDQRALLNEKRITPRIISLPAVAEVKSTSEKGVEDAPDKMVRGNKARRK